MRMFTGLVEETGEVCSLEEGREGGVRLVVRAPGISAGVVLGDSVAVNGCCLTVAAHEGDRLGFDLLQETLARTSLRKTQSLLVHALATKRSIAVHEYRKH